MFLVRADSVKVTIWVKLALTGTVISGILSTYGHMVRFFITENKSSSIMLLNFKYVDNCAFNSSVLSSLIERRPEISTAMIAH